MRDISRRRAIGAAGAAVGAFLVGRLSVAEAQTPKKESGVVATETATPTSVVWKPVKLDPQRAAARAHQLYAEGSCMYAAFNSIRLEMAAAVAESDPAYSKALAEFPGQMMRYGHSGLGGMGTLCGVVNGCSAMFGLLIPDKAMVDTLIAELCNFYEQSELPVYKPKDSKFETIEKSKAGSVLCHVSQTVWCKKSGHSPFSDFRSERCKRLTADCVAKAVEILNRFADSSTAGAGGKLLDSDSKACVACHGKSGIVANVSGKMNCTSCHSMEEHY